MDVFSRTPAAAPRALAQDLRASSLVADGLVMTRDYGDATRTHASVNDELFTLFEPHLHRFEGRTRVGIANYGCADGRNCQSSLHRLLQTLRAPLGVERAHLAFNDLLPSNEARVAEQLAKIPATITQTFPKLSWAFEGGSFYERRFDPASIDLGFCVNAMHWQARVEGPRRDLAHYSGVAHRELREFLRHRAAELRPGGLLLLANSTLGAQGRLHPVPKTMQAVMDQMHREGLITTQEHAALYFPMYMRSPAELTAPFDLAADGVALGMRVLGSHTRTFPCQYAAALRRSEGTAADRRRYAEGLAASRRAWSHSTIRAVLGPLRAELLHRRYRERLVEADPAGEESDFTIHFLLLEKLPAAEAPRPGKTTTRAKAQAAWAQLPAPLQEKYPAPGIEVDRIEVHGHHARIRTRLGGPALCPVQLRAHLGSVAMQMASQICVAVGHLCNGVTRKIDETFLLDVDLSTREPEPEELSALAAGRPLFATVQAEPLRAHASRSNPGLVRKLYAFEFDLGHGLAKGSMKLHFSLPRPEHGDPLQAEPVRRTYEGEQLAAVLSTYLGSHDAIGQETIELAAVEHDSSRLRARIRMPEYFTSGTDDGGFHLSAVLTDLIVHTLATLHARVGLGARARRRGSTHLEFKAPLRDPEQIEVELQLEEHGRWSVHITSGGGRGEGSIALDLSQA